MGFWRSLKWAVSEGTGMGIGRRLARFLGETWPGIHGPQYLAAPEFFSQFLASASISVNRFGPAWARRKVGSRTIGVWLLLILWGLLPMAIALIGRDGGWNPA